MLLRDRLNRRWLGSCALYFPLVTGLSRQGQSIWELKLAFLNIGGSLLLVHGLVKGLLLVDMQLVDFNANSFRINDKEEVDDEGPYCKQDGLGVAQVLPLTILSKKSSCYLGTTDMSHVVAGSPDTYDHTASLLWEPRPKSCHHRRPDAGICKSD